jgi:heat shock protein HslJ
MNAIIRKALLASLPLVSACASVRAQTTTIRQGNLLGSWSLAQLGTARVVNSMTLTFEPGGLLAGTLRCNTLSGTYQVRSPTIVFSDPIITTAGCPRDRWPDDPTVADEAANVVFRDLKAKPLLSFDRQRLVFPGSQSAVFIRTGQRVR